MGLRARTHIHTFTAENHFCDSVTQSSGSSFSLCFHLVNTAAWGQWNTRFFSIFRDSKICLLALKRRVCLLGFSSFFFKLILVIGHSLFSMIQLPRIFRLVFGAQILIIRYTVIWWLQTESYRNGNIGFKPLIIANALNVLSWPSAAYTGSIWII